MNLTLEGFSFTFSFNNDNNIKSMVLVLTTFSSQNLQTRYESVEDTSKELKSELQPLEGAIRELRRREDHAREMHVVMTTTEGRANQVREDRRKLEASIRNVFQVRGIFI